MRGGPAFDRLIDAACPHERPKRSDSWFKRFLLPGLAFKAVVIGGGYATGRELAEFFLSVGPWGGLLAHSALRRSC